MTSGITHVGEDEQDSPEHAPGPRGGPGAHQDTLVNQQWRALLDMSSEGIVGLDAEACCPAMNRRAEELLGYVEPECLGRNIHELIHAKRPDGSPCVMAACPIY